MYSITLFNYVVPFGLKKGFSFNPGTGYFKIDVIVVVDNFLCTCWFEYRNCDVVLHAIVMYVVPFGLEKGFSF